MYPIFRMMHQMYLAKKQGPLGPTETHISRHMCLPWDLDIWMELNNGRTLTIYDLGRIPLAVRTGLIKILKKKQWGLTMAGASVRYRQRIRAFETITMHSRLAYWDERFFYLEQSMWKADGNCANQIVYRAATTSKDGIVPPDDVIAAGDTPIDKPKAPEWIAAWITAEAVRPWPPMRDHSQE